MDIAEKVKEYMDDPAVEEQFESDLRELIEIPSVAGAADGKYVFGRECGRVLETALAIGEKYGFRAENHDYYCGSLVFGDNPREIGIVAHLDVVPCGGGWSYEPYALTVDGGKYIGRGTEDDKGPLLTALYAMRYLKESGEKLPFTVRLIMGCDEEVGSSDLKHFASVRRVPEFSFTPDAEFPVCIGEKGIFSFDIMLGELPGGVVSFRGGTVSNAVADSASCTVITDRDPSPAPGITISRDGDKLVVTASGKGAHASMPENSVNAVGVLCKYLISEGLADTEGLRFLSEACSQYKGEIFGIDKTDKDFGYLTCICGLAGCEQGVLKANFNVRYIPSTPYDSIAESIKKSAEKHGFSAEVYSPSPGYYVSADDRRIRALTDSCSEVLGVSCAPYTMGGGTYARYLKNTVAFGATIEKYRGAFGEGKGGAHERDEYLSREEVVKAAQIFVMSLLRIARSEDQ